MPSAGYHSSLSTYQVNIQVLKIELAHLFASALITLLISLKGCIPTLGNCAAGEKCQVGRVPIAVHKTLQVTMVPGFNLGNQQMLDCFLCLGSKLLGVF